MNLAEEFQYIRGLHQTTTVRHHKGFSLSKIQKQSKNTDKILKILYQYHITATPPHPPHYFKVTLGTRGNTSTHSTSTKKTQFARLFNKYDRINKKNALNPLNSANPRILQWR